MLCLAAFPASCVQIPLPTASRQDRGAVDGNPFYLYTLTNSNGLTAHITKFGGIVTEFHNPDREAAFRSA